MRRRSHRQRRLPSIPIVATKHVAQGGSGLEKEKEKFTNRLNFSHHRI
jgi:hypothetical protein